MSRNLSTATDDSYRGACTEAADLQQSLTNAQQLMGFHLPQRATPVRLTLGERLRRAFGFDTTRTNGAVAGSIM